ncbi:iron-sulfur cluster carrier protein ApbC [Thalassotalea euphylliae]|uniref:Iron-sulfur cluster carrier protein n=1 Tax=Thalassotalea euphylliae TaxID=1655234 RepID=A0A3E0TWP8_9GAMM|nr:iron-sulfur cluster carrier protein ApbC [Thalassotalea euphylliae]
MNPEDLSLIESVLDAYRSDAFPHGVLAVANELASEQQKDKLLIAIDLPFCAGDELTSIAHSLSDELSKTVEFTTSSHIEAVRQHNIAGVKNIIAIASGKGGVGKSTTTVNIARALQKQGARVGILDADIYGPSIPTMLGCQDDKPSSVDGKTMIPIDADGIYSMSIGYLVPDSDAAVWRGPMASTAFSQLLNETQWPALDYLLIDMPPGTGDIQLTLSQKVPVAGAVIVTTPQDIALADAQKGIAMFDKVKVPVLGVVENMSYHICENCGHHSHLFGLDGGKDIAEINKVDLLGQLPLNIQVRQEADLGESLFNSESASDICDQYRRIASNLASKVFHLLDMRSPATPSVEFTDS